MLGLCTGKVRSTPTPKETLRTVKVSRTPPPWRRITTPLKTCTRSFEPSMTLTCTLRVSPGRNSGMSSRRDFLSRKSRVFIGVPSLRFRRSRGTERHPDVRRTPVLVWFVPRSSIAAWSRQPVHCARRHRVKRNRRWCRVHHVVEFHLRRHPGVLCRFLHMHGARRPRDEILHEDLGSDHRSAPLSFPLESPEHPL